MFTEDDIAKQMLEVIPPLMHQVRCDMRFAAVGTLTIPQFRILSNILNGKRHVSQIAEHHGVSQPAMSKMVDGLVRRSLIKRVAHDHDRRHIVLELTVKGSNLFSSVKKKAQKHMGQRLKKLTAKEKTKLFQSLSQIENIFREEITNKRRSL